MRKYRARKKQQEGLTAAELAGWRDRCAALADENARLRALLAQVGALAAAAGPQQQQQWQPHDDLAALAAAAPLRLPRR